MYIPNINACLQHHIKAIAVLRATLHQESSRSYRYNFVLVVFKNEDEVGGTCGTKGREEECV
jgi:hypothetical protein